jgi:hypothetical protein
MGKEAVEEENVRAGPDGKVEIRIISGRGAARGQ